MGRERDQRSTRVTTDTEPEVAKRRAIVNRNPGARVKGLCEIFDNAKLPVPPDWAVPSWSKAYRIKVYRSRVQVIVSKDRKKCS